MQRVRLANGLGSEAASKRCKRKEDNSHYFWKTNTKSKSQANRAQRPRNNDFERNWQLPKDYSPEASDPQASYSTD